MTSPLPGPAFIAQMPPSPETSRRWWTMYCRECGIEEMMSATPDEPRLIEHRDAHNREVHGPSPLPTDEDAREAALMQDRVDWYVDHEAEPGIATNAFVRGYDAGFRRSVVSTPDPEDVRELIDEARTWTPNTCDSAPVAGAHMIERLADALEASAVSAPPTITDEMVERAAIEYHERGNGEGSFDRVSDHVRSSLRFRMRAALRAALNPKGDS